MYCKKCGKEVDASMAFCANCGERVEMTNGNNPSGTSQQTGGNNGQGFGGQGQNYSGANYSQGNQYNPGGYQQATSENLLQFLKKCDKI